MISLIRFKEEVNIAEQEMLALTDEQLVKAMEDFKDPNYIAIALKRGTPFFHEITGTLLAINYFAVKKEIYRRMHVLKSCPHCDGEVDLDMMSNIIPFIVCRECGLATCNRNGCAADLVRDWNKRV